MFPCIVVALELALLALAYWYVFVKEEKPYKILGDPWGNYDGIHDPTIGKVSGEIASGKLIIRTTLLPDEPGCDTVIRTKSA
ncbi:MAG TPA: hypothetical protein V6C81_19030 [Planktothrix sp.]|jgi:hypothetical protein